RFPGRAGPTARGRGRIVAAGRIRRPGFAGESRRAIEETDGQDGHATPAIAAQVAERPRRRGDGRSRRSIGPAHPARRRYERTPTTDHVSPTEDRAELRAA